MSSIIQGNKEILNNSVMVLTIDIGNGICDKLSIHDINNYQEESYDFCAKNNLDFNTMKEINHQIQNVLMNSGALKNEFNFKKKQGKSLYIKKNSFKQNKENYSNKNKNIIHKNSEIDTNKKVVKRYNEKPLNYLTQRMKDSNINNNYSSFVHSQRGYTSSTKGSSIKEFNIKTNVKNAFNSLKGNSERNIMNNHDSLKYNNKSNGIKSGRHNSSEYNMLIRDSHNRISDGNNEIIFTYSHNKKNNKSNKKRKESIEILNQDEINNKNEKNKNNEMMIIEFESNNSNKKNNEENSKKKNINDKFNNILNSISLISNEFNKYNTNTERMVYKSNKTETNEKKEKENNLINKSDFYKNSKLYYNFSSVDNIKKYKKCEDKIKNLKELQEFEFNRLHTFRPLINNNTKTETNQETKNHKRSCTSSRYEKLYEYRISYKENKKKLSEKYVKNYSFHPKINSMSSFPITNISFNERLKLYSSRSKDIMSKLQKSIEKQKKLDESFNPKINTEKNQIILKKERKTIENSFNKNFKHKQLRIYEKKYIKRAKLLTDKNLEEQNRTDGILQKKDYNNITNIRKENCFKIIFKLLGNGKEKISYKTINIKNIPKDIKNILEPILTELNNSNETLIESEFIFICEKLYDSLKYEQKEKLLLFEKQEEIKKQRKEKAIKENKPQLNKSRTNSTIATVSSERANKNLNRVASCETGKNKNKIKRNNEIKKINYYFSKPKYMMQINNFINEDKKLRENKNIINNISLSAFLKNKNNNELSENKVNTFNLSNLIVQNLNNKVDKEIKYRNDDNNLYN